MANLTQRRTKRRSTALLAVGLALSAALGGTAPTLAAAGKAQIPAVRAATNRYHDINAAFADGYVIFYQCTEQPGVGVMGQHLVKPSLVGDANVDPLQPEVLVYEPTRNGGWKLVAVEYVTLDTSSQPWVLGQKMNFRAQGNRYGLPDFYSAPRVDLAGQSARTVRRLEPEPHVPRHGRQRRLAEHHRVSVE